MIMIRRSRVICSLVLIMALALTSCASGSVMLGNVSAHVLTAASPAEADQILEYLKAAKNDFALIDALIEDQNLGLMEEDSAASEDLTTEDVSYYLGLLEDYKTNIQGKLAEIKSRATPGNDDISFFRTAEISQFELASDVIVEYMQVLNYMNALLKMGDALQKLENVNTDNPEGTYSAMNNGITKAIEELESSEVPTFLESMNDNMIALLKEMNDAVLYLLRAADLNDPVRADSAEYRMGILLRKFTRISTDADKDMDVRDAKLKSDLKNIQLVNKSLGKWVQDNIDRLNEY